MPWEGEPVDEWIELMDEPSHQADGASNAGVSVFSNLQFQYLHEETHT